MKKIVLFFVVCMTASMLIGQDHMFFTKSFTKKVNKHNLEFFLPVERWMKASNVKKDKYMKYDIVLHSPPNVEVRIDIKKDNRRLFPNVEIARVLAHISTNDEDAFIEITQYPQRYSKDYYSADLVLYADFTPKPGYSNYKRGRMLCLYKEGEALIKYIILYEGELDPYFKMPLRFRKEMHQ